MSKIQLGLFKTPLGGENYGYWDPDTGEVTVGIEKAGKASTQQEAWQKANLYATTPNK